MNPRQNLGWITDDSYEFDYQIYAVMVFPNRVGYLPGGLVLSDKVNGELAIHHYSINEEKGQVSFYSGIYPQSSLDEAMKVFLEAAKHLEKIFEFPLV